MLDMASNQNSDTLCSLDTFKHDCLDSPSEQIRLIRLLDDEHKNELSIRISTWSAADAPEYIAISYTWGDESEACTISINEKDFTVRHNCCYALQQVRQQHPSEYIWIDSLCINQNDTKEKSFQVSKMTDVYAKAKSVYLCVGPHMDSSELLKRYGEELKTINEKLQTQEMTYEDFKHLDDSPKEGPFHPFHPLTSHLMLAWAYESKRQYTEEAVLTVLAFTRRSYWKRLWIVQEIAFAKSKTVLCGDHALDWEIIKLFQDLIWNFDYQTHFTTVMYYAEPKGVSLAQAIRFFSTFHCSDVRDHLFGILGLINWAPEEHAITTADYSLSPHDVLLRIISSLECHNPIILQVLKVFGFDPNSRQSQHLLQLGRSTYTGEANTGSQRSDFLSSLQLWRINATITRIDEDANNRLVVTFVRERRENLYYVASPDYSLYTYRHGKIPSFAVPVYSGDSLAGLACTNARKGDLLASIWSHRSDVSLVLRHFKDDMYTIIGQALTVNGFSIDNDAQFPDPKILLALSAEELFLLWSQDYVGDSSKTLNDYEIFDPKAHLQRLQTAVVLFPDIMEPRVRVSLCEDDC